MKTKLYLLGIFVLTLIFAPVALAQYGLQDTAKGTGIPMTGTLTGKVGQITGAALSLIGVVFFVLMVYGGFLWMTARGEAKTAEKAKGIIIDSIIGLVIVGAAYVITSFVFTAITTK
ncbi:MAG: hypothetical protein NTU97_01825 [Candidatus Magasanikbacteria bacterium]|nr:hypothetical protein [Candidatus Magasanikbacteria bacterium]